MKLYNIVSKVIFLLVCSIVLISTTGCDNTETEANLSPINPEIDTCLNNIGQDVIQKRFAADPFPGNDCGVTLFGKGISLNIYSDFYQQNLSDKEYILYRLNQIATQYGYGKYSILLSDNQYELATDREVEIHQVQ